MLIAGYTVTAQVFNARIETAPTVADLELSWQQCSGNVALMAIGLFGIIRSIRWEGQGIVGRFFSDATQKGYAIYLAHIIILSEISKLLIGCIGSVTIEIPLISIATFVLTYLLVLLLSMLPKSEKWLGY